MADKSLITQEQLQSDFEDFYSQKIYPFLNGATHAGFTPVGSVIAIMGNEAPNHYLVCDGTLYTIVDYPQLTEFIIDQFGIVNYFGGNGTTTFAVPDLSEEAPTSSSLCIAYENTYIDGSGQSSGGGHKIQNEGDLEPLTQRKTMLLNEPLIASDDAEGGNTVVDVDTDVDLSVIQAPGTAGNVEGHIYSTDETVVGKWINSKPVYEKVIIIPFASTIVDGESTSNSISVSNLNIERIIELGGIYHQDNGNANIIPHYWTTGDNSYYTRIFYNHPDEQIMVISNRSVLAGLVNYVKLRYTKTTDTVQS